MMIADLDYYLKSKNNAMLKWVNDYVEKQSAKEGSHPIPVLSMLYEFPWILLPDTRACTLFCIRFKISGTAENSGEVHRIDYTQPAFDQLKIAINKLIKLYR